jgi:DNA-binding NtrC family response regulator
LSSKILVVDDDPAIRAMVRSVLQREGLTVDDAHSGNEAIRLLEERNYSAIVLDVVMPDGSGRAVLEVVAQQRPEVKCVIVISAASPAELDDLPEPNLMATLRKPFNISDLVHAVETCMTAPDDPEPALT